jgi:AraC family transcriptional regulator of arabinose operon
MDYVNGISHLRMDYVIIIGMNKKRNIPFESAVNKWKNHTQGFGDVEFLAMPQQERKKWVNHSALSYFHVFSCGYYAKAHGHNFERQHLDEGILVFCVDGRGHAELGGKQYDIEAGDLLYFPPFSHHSYMAHPSDPWTIYWMHVSGPQLANYERILGVGNETPVKHPGLEPELIHLFKLLLKTFQPVPTETQWLSMQICSQHIIARAASLHQPERVSRQNAIKIHEVITFMESNTDARLSLEQMASKFDVSVSHFCRIFKQYSGQSPMDYFIHLKIRKACSLLTFPQLKVKEIAFKLGFDDPYYFSRYFKKVIGLSPLHYRQNIREIFVPPENQ